MTIAQWLRTIAVELQESGIYAGFLADESQHQAAYEAEELLCHVAGWTRLTMLQRLAGPIQPELAFALQPCLQRRKAGEPLAYILGYAHFYGRVFRTRPGCLIPRPDTEPLVEQAILWIRAHRPDGIVIDLGTGSGCIATTIALECGQTSVIGIDLSEGAATIARENAALLGAVIDVRVTDGLRLLEEGFMRPNVVVSNPPYIPTAEVTTLDSSVLHYEPVLALDGGPDGLDFYQEFVQITPAMFRDGPAALFLEVGMNQADDVTTMFSTDERWRAFRVDKHVDLRGVFRVVSVVRNE